MLANACLLLFISVVEFLSCGSISVSVMISPTTAVQITAVVLFFHVQAKKLLSHAFPKIDHSCLLDKVIHAFF